MKTGIFKLDWANIGDALITAATLAALVAIGSVVFAGDFNLFTADWSMIGKNTLNGAFVGGFGSLYQALISDHQGNVLGIKTQ